MVIKKSVQCANCRGYMDIYIKENQQLKGRTTQCKCCGNNYKCISEKQGIIKWRVM